MNLTNKINVIAPFLFLALGLASCSDDNSGSKVVTPWEIQAPYFKIYNNQTDEASKSQTLNRIDLNNTDIQLSTTDELVFEQSFSEAQLNSETVCQAADDRAFKKTSRSALLKENKIYRFLPDEVLLLPTHELKNVKCTVRFVAISANGSTHDFGQNINFTLVGENRDFLIKLEDENESEQNSQWPSVSLITLQRARYFFLNRQENSSYRLKCTDFESTMVNPQTLLDLIEKAPQEGLARDQLCRVFAVSKNDTTQITKLFNLRFFDTKNYIESVVNKPEVQRSYMTANVFYNDVYLNQITLFNRTKYPVYFSVQNVNLKVDTVFRKSLTTAMKKGQLNIAVKARTNPNIKATADRTIFVLMPGQKMLVAYTLAVRSMESSVSFSVIDKGPTLDLLDKKSWEDKNENVMTSIPLMSHPTVHIALYGPHN